MKIAFNPSTVAALITPPNNKDITFDLRGRNIFARGVKFCGTDTWRDIKINNVSIDSNILDLRNGSNTTLTNTNGVVTINSTWRPVVDNLTSNSTTSSLSANQGRVLKALIDGKSDSGHNHDNRYVKKSGDTMSGVLTIDTTNFGALTIKRNDDANGASIQFRGKSSVYGYIGLNNSTKDKQFLRWNSDTSKTYTILDTSSTYTSNGKGVINGTTITQVDNATNSTNSTNARKLVNWYSARPTSLNTQFGDGSLRIFYATSSTTEGKPAEDSPILHLAWDNNGGFDAQLAVHTRSGKVSTRAQNGGTWQPWKTLAFTTDIPSSLKNPYSLTTFGVVYDGSAAKTVTTSTFISQVTEGTATVTDGTMFITSYASNSGFADTNAINVPYKRKAIHLWEYIKAKTDSLYATKSHNHDNKYLKWLGNAGQSNMNAIGRISHSSGMTNLSDPRNTIDNPMEGGSKSTSWHLYWQTNYTDDPSGSNAWVAQIVNRAGTDRWWVRSRSGGTITNGANWTSNWRFLVTAPTSGLGGSSQPVYINSAGEVVAANSYPTSLKNPHLLTLKANGTTLATYDGSSAKEVNFTYTNIGAASASHTHDDRYIRKWTGVYGSANKFLKLVISDEKGWIRLEVSDSNNALSGGYGIYIIGWGYHGNNGTDTLFARCLYANDSRYTTALKIVRTSRNNYDFYFQFASGSSYPSYTINYSSSVSSIDCTVTAIDTIPTATWTSSLSALQLNASQVDWSGITNKPSVFNPAAHTHTVFKNNLMIKGTNGVSDSASIHLGIGDSDTGFKWISDGVCQIYANNTAVGEWTSGGMNWFKNPTVNGNKIWNAGNDGSGSGLDADTVDGEHASNFSYTHQTSFDFNTIKNGRIVTFDQSNTNYGWINGFASTHSNYLTSVLFNTHRTSNWYVGYIEGDMSTGKTDGLQAVHKLAFVDQIPTSLKNPYALTISLNGTSQGPYDGSAAKNINITPSSIGAATSGHTHDGRYLRWNGSTADISAMSWGTLTAANGYTILSHAASYDGGDMGFVNKGGQIFMQLDGYYYQKEGQYRVLDTSDFTTFSNIGSQTTRITIGGITKDLKIDADLLDGYHASAFVKINQFRFRQYNQGTWTKILTITINSTTDLQPAIAFSWIPSECSRTIWADFSINWRSNSPIFYAIWKGMDSRTLKVVNSSGAIWDVWVSGSKASWDPFGEIQVTYTHNITSYNGGSLGYSDTDPGGTICITGGQVNYANSAGSATKVIVNQHTTNDTNYPLVWSNQNNTNNATENQLYKSWSDLYYNPKNKRLTVGGSVVASSFVKSGGTSQQLLRADGGIATFNWSGQSGQPTWLWGGNNQHSYYIYNPSNFRVAYAETAGSADNIGGISLSGIFTAFGNNGNNITATIGGITKEFQVNYASNADKLDGYHEYSFLRYRGSTSTDQEATLWSQIGIKKYTGALPDGLTGVYNYGSVISLPCDSSRFEIYASHQSSNGNGLYYRSGWNSDKKSWLKFIDSSNIGSQSVNYANSAGNADTLDGEHAKDFVRAGYYNSTDLNSLDTYSFIRSVNSQVSSTSPKGNTGWYNVIQAVHRNGDDDGPNYMGQIALGMTTNRDDMFFRTKYENTWNSWKIVIHSGNYTEFINNYYWANVKISTSSSTTTSPTVSNLTATSSIKMGNILLEHTDEINNSTNGGIHLNYRSSGNVSLCQGGGNVGIGNMTPSYKLDVNGQVRASGFHHSSMDSNNYILLAGGGYSQGVPVKYWSIESISIYGPTQVFRVNRGGNYTFVTKVEPRINGSCVLTLQFPSGYYYENTIIWSRGVLNNDISNSSNSTIYATIFQFSESKYYLNLSDDDSLNNGTCQLYFMCF